MPASTPLNILFAGTPDFAAASLQALLDSEHRVLAVLTQPDRPAGRGKKVTVSPVKQLAVSADIPVWQPDTLKDAEIQQHIHDAHADVMVVVAYGLIVPQTVLDMPRYGCVNVHGSLLPRWRGAAPIQRAIAAGDTETGVGIMQMEAGLDTGPVLLERRTTIAPNDTGGSLHDRLAALGATALLDALADLPALREAAQPQPAEGVTYAHKLGKEEARLDWQQPAVALANQVRAFNPWPVAWFSLAGQAVRVWAAQAVAGDGAPGTVLAVGEQGIDVACADGVLRLQQLQRPGKRAMPVADILRGHPEFLQAGDQLG
ncbi:MAG: methionyl-tRNA formyltransferase [Alcanivoracaceae bacterium]|jgi:methionyl-tRNA formyltransferase|nr:methionyl-tRNA formyltransferase [Alcanivoracaceae bacterium]